MPTLKHLRVFTYGSFFVVLACPSLSCKPTSMLNENRWDAMSEMQREQCVHDLISSGDISIGKTTKADLEHLFVNQKAYFNKYVLIINFLPAFHSVQKLDPQVQTPWKGRYAAFDVDSAGIVRSVTFSRENK